MRREAAITVVALIAACTQEGSTASGQTGPSSPEGLAYFHLSESGDGRVSFAESETQGGVQVLSDVTILGEDGEEVRAETLRISGARETSDGMVFDSLEILNLTGASEGDSDSDAAPSSGKGPTKGPATTSVSEGGSFTIDRVLIEQPNALLASFIAQALSTEGVDEDADWGDPSEYAFETFAFEGFSAEADGGVVAFDTLRLSGMADSRLAGFVFENLTGSGSEDGTDVTFALGSLSLNGLDMSGIDAFADVDAEDPEALDQALSESGLNDPFRQRYDDYELAGLQIDADGVIIGLDRFAGEAAMRGGALEMDDELSGLTVEFDDTKEMGAQGLAGLQMLGYDRIEINGRFVQSADRDADRVSSDEYGLAATDALALELDYDIGGIQAYMEAASEAGMSFADNLDPDQAMEMFAPLTIHSFELRLIDDSIVERALQAVADTQGSTPEQIRQQAIAFMTIGTMMVPPGAAQVLTSEAIDAATTFLEEPGTLRISIQPDEPVSFADLMAAFESEDYDTALALMNVEIAAE